MPKLATEINNNSLADDDDAKVKDQTPVPYFKSFKTPILWSKVFNIWLLHTLFLGLGPALVLTKISTLVFGYILTLAAVLGVQVGAHRYYCHRAFKANFAFRLLIVVCQTISLQKDIYDWCRDHRVHHKFSETDADPHNSNRGFFFSHMGWLMLSKHPEVRRKGATIDLSDVIADPLVRLQRKYYYFVWVPIFWFAIPVAVPMYFWGESFYASFMICVIARYTITLHITFLVNSWAHAYGNRPYSEKLIPVEASCRHMLMGEGFHNYHHVFPNDYSASEFGPMDVFNPATAIINFFAAIGWAWDLKKADPKLIRKIAAESGDKQAQYQLGTRRWIVEWVGGLVVMLMPFWAMVVVKYIFIYFFEDFVHSLFK